MKEYCSESTIYVDVLKVFAKLLFEFLEDENLFTLELHANHVAEDVKKLGDILFSGASPFEHFNHTVYQLIWGTTGHHSTALEEIFKEINLSSGSRNELRREATEVRSFQLNRNRVRIPFEGLKQHTSEKLNQIDRATRNSFRTCLLDCGNYSYFPSRRLTVASNVTLTAVKSLLIKGGATISLQQYNLPAGELCRSCSSKQICSVSLQPLPSAQ